MQAGYYIAQFIFNKLNAMGWVSARNWVANLVGVTLATTIMNVLAAGGVVGLGAYFGFHSYLYGFFAGPIGAVVLGVVGSL
ncbi:MAG: hypothetical protein LBI84_04285 [Propionibacteriaceae bacterium]|jgi:hypothetical protein|nr:hypothetical protein [Propionibacteriaceae bacterium]